MKMASTSNNNPYTFQRASTMATRSLISDTKPSEIASTSSNDVKGHAKETLQHETTTHYEQAAAEATKADRIPATTAASAAASLSDRPGAKRQQNWKMSASRCKLTQLYTDRLPGVTSKAKSKERCWLTRLLRVVSPVSG